MADTIRKTRKTEGFDAWVSAKGIDPMHYKRLVDRGQTIAGLMRDFDLSRDSVIKDLNQLARERGYTDWHSLYKANDK